MEKEFRNRNGLAFIFVIFNKVAKIYFYGITDFIFVHFDL